MPAAQKATLHAMTAAHLTDAVGFNIPLTLRNQAELEACVTAGEVLSGEELKAKYFPLQSDYDAVATWLKGEGFTVDAIADTNLAVFAHGTVAQVQASFQVETGLVTVDGADRAVTLSTPSLPADIAKPALGVSGLSYRRPKSRIAFPNGPITNATGVPSGGYHINQLATAYSGTGLSVNGTTLTGAGQTIAIEAYVQVKSTDLSTFWSANSVTRTGTVTTVNVNNATLATDAGDVEENALDVEWASGIAPGANIVDYATNYDTNDAPERIYNRVIADALAAGSTVHQLSSSYGPTEAQLTATELSAYNQIFLSLTAAGCTYINATGDIGSSSNGVLTPEAYGVFPYTFGVGGTTLNVNTTTYARATETGWSGSSGGVSAKFAHPTWQTGTGTLAADNRQFPDIALAADPNTGAYFVYNGKVSEVGGTSWSAPTFAGFLALIHQGRSLNTPARGPVGFLNPRIYPLILSANFFDVISGSNTGYSAGTGYDMVTGVGRAEHRHVPDDTARADDQRLHAEQRPGGRQRDDHRHELLCQHRLPGGGVLQRHGSGFLHRQQPDADHRRGACRRHERTDHRDQLRRRDQQPDQLHAVPRRTDHRHEPEQREPGRQRGCVHADGLERGRTADQRHDDGDGHPGPRALHRRGQWSGLDVRPPTRTVPGVGIAPARTP